MFLSTRLRMTTPRRSWIGLVLVLALVVSLAAHFAANPGSETRSVMAARPVMADLNNMQLSFIPNMGQADPAGQYHVRSMGGTLYFTNENVVFVLPSEPLDSNESVTSYVVRLNFEGANPAPTFSSLDRLPGLANYFKGDDPAQWHSNVPMYGGIQYNQIYPGIDLRYEGSEGVLKGSYVVAPGVDPAQIRWSYAQSDSVALDATSGDLRIQLPQLEGEDPAEIVERAPVAWQTIDGEQVPVDVRYALDAGSVSFVVGDYDPAYELVLDPILQYSSYYGGSLVDQAYSMAADTEGNVYLTGLTMGGTFLTVQPYQAAVLGG
ncbi:MAG TPA: SBBP repeat-containing protein, partial [Aggregatilineaceae bacterium]|nr:SBBP repeat-containing protein [Aggregatilineaceae bacterium]